MFDTVNQTLVSAVASGATITFAYPTGRTAGHYTGAHAHKLYAMGAEFSAPNDFTIAFGATIVLTYNGSTTIPAGARVAVQLDRLGVNDGKPDGVVLPFNMARSPLHLIDLGSPATLDADGLVKAATGTELPDATPTSVAYEFPGDGGTSPLDGANQTGILDVPRNITATVTHDSSVVAMTIKVMGEDVDGAEMYEELSIAATGTSQTAAGVKAFKKVTSVELYAAADATTNTVNVGWGDVLGLPVYVPDAGYVVAELQSGAVLARKPGYVYIMDRMLAAAVDAGTAHNMVSPVAGVISKLTTIAQAGIITGGAITVEVNTTAVDGLSVTVANSSSEGDVDSDTPTAGHASTAVAVGDRIEIIPASGFNGSGDIFFILEIKTSAAQQLDGTFVAGVTTKATATTGDPRGTYDPTAACDGTTQFALLVALPDPGNDGVPQYTV